MKKSLRNVLLKRRASIKPELKSLKEAAIKKRLFALADFKKAKSILFYASFRSEVDTIRCLQDVIRSGKKLALPVVDHRHKELKIFEVKDISELISGYMGIPEPEITKNREIGLKDIGIVVVPGAGFDINGNRLGYGAGYYDKLLSKSKKHITTIALAFEEQIVKEIPAEPHDIKVDMIVTDKRLIRCRT